MNENTLHQPSEYRSFLVRFQRHSADQAWRILVRNITDGSQHALVTMAELVAFLAHETEQKEISS